MINQQNIARYIDYLHQRKYNMPANQDLKDKWAQVPNSEIPQQLHMLYAHWNMTDADGKTMENAFLEQSYKTSEQSMYTPNPSSAFSGTTMNHNTPVVEKKKSNTGIIVLAVFIIGALAGYIVYDKVLNPSSSDNDASVLTNTSANSAASNRDNNVATATATASEKPIDNAASKAEENVDIEAEKASRTATIRKLVAAEDRRDISTILSTFSPNMTEYWDLKKPTPEQLKKRYEHTWTVSEENQIKNPSIKRISKNVYDLFGEYTFFSVKDQKYKTVPVHSRFVFDDNGKIIKTYGVKK